MTELIKRALAKLLRLWDARKRKRILRRVVGMWDGREDIDFQAIRREFDRRDVDSKNSTSQD